MAVRKRAWRTRKGETKATWVVDFVDDQGQRARRQFTTKREADVFRGETEGELRSGIYRAESNRVTVKEAADQFLAYCYGRMERRERMTRGNLETLTGHIRNYICPEPGRSERAMQNVTYFESGLAALKLRQLSSRVVGDFRDRMRAAGLSVPMTRKVLGTLRLILGYAISQDLIAINVAQGVRVIGRRDEGSKVIVAPSKEAVRMLLAAADPDFRIVILFAAVTGLRASEMHALRWRHLDLIKGEVRVETRVDEFGQEDFTKTVAGLRSVPLGASIVAALREWRQRFFIYCTKRSRVSWPLRRLSEPQLSATGAIRSALHLDEGDAQTRLERLADIAATLQLARVAAFRDLVLDRGWAEPEDDPDLRRAFEPGDDDGSIWASV